MLAKNNIYTFFLLFVFSTALVFAQKATKEISKTNKSKDLNFIQAPSGGTIKFLGANNDVLGKIIEEEDDSGKKFGVIHLTGATDNPTSISMKHKLWIDGNGVLRFWDDELGTGWIRSGNTISLFNVNNRVSIGIGSGISDKLTVHGKTITNSFKMADGTHGLGKVLTSDANGDATWQTPSGGGPGGSIDGLSDGKSTTNSNSVYLGLGAGVNDDSYNGNTISSYNTGVGINALNKNGTAASFYGEKNTAVGFEALKNLDNNNGNNNVAFGYQSHLNNDDGHENTALGSQAMLNYSGGFGNTVVGYQALKGSANGRLGNYNTVIGYNALPDLTTTNTSGDQGSYNVVIGYEAAKGHTNIKEELFIQNHRSSGSNPADPLIWGDFNFRKVQLFVRNHSTTNKFYVNNSAGGTSAWDGSSDRRLKKNIYTIPNALERVKNLRGVNFEWKEPETHRYGLQMGFIAQEAIEVIPEVVNNKSEFMSMTYSSITAILVEAMKEQQKIIEELKKQNYSLEKRLTSIENSIRSRNVKTVSK